MRAISAENLAALRVGTIAPRDFLWINVRRRDTGAPYAEGYWSGIGQLDASVIHPDTGLVTARTWHGAGQLISIDPIPAVSNLTMQTVTIRLSQVEDRVNDLLRFYEPKFGQVEIYRGLLDVTTQRLVAPAFLRFLGIMDGVEVQTPEAGGEGSVNVTVSGHDVELTRTSTATRSDADQRKRNPNDDFFADAAVVGQWEIRWGQKSKKAGK